MSNLLSLTSSQLNQAARLKDKIADLEKQLTAILGVSAAAAVSKPAKKGISAAGIAKIKAAQKARWAKINSGKSSAPSAAKPAGKKRRSMSAAARAKIATAAKARWAKVKAAGKNTL